MESICILTLREFSQNSRGVSMYICMCIYIYVYEMIEYTYFSVLVQMQGGAWVFFTWGDSYICMTWLIEYRALLKERRAHLIDSRALPIEFIDSYICMTWLIEYRALLIRRRALLIDSRALPIEFIDSYNCTTWRIYIRDVARWYEWRGSLNIGLFW